MIVLACAAQQRPLGEDERPNLVVVLETGPSEEALAVVWPAVAGPSAEHAFLASQWDPGSNTLPTVLALYGYQTARVGSPQGATALGFAEGADSGWLRTAPQPFLLLDPTGSVELGSLAERGLLSRTVVVRMPLTEPGTLSWSGPRRPRVPAEAMVGTLDVVPTLLAVAGATIPTDAAGVSLTREAPRKALFEVLADGSFGVRSTRHHLVVAARDPLPDACPAEARLTDAAGAGSDDAAARAALYAALQAWRARETAPSARDRLGTEEFLRLNASQGYWQ